MVGQTNRNIFASIIINSTLDTRGAPKPPVCGLTLCWARGSDWIGCTRPGGYVMNFNRHERTVRSLLYHYEYTEVVFFSFVFRIKYFKLPDRVWHTGVALRWSHQ